MRLWVLLLAAGCAQELRVEDHSVLFPTIRASKRINETVMIDVIADYASGSDTAEGSTGRPIVIGGQSFPVPVAVDFDLTTVRVEGRAHHDISPYWLVEGFFGAAFYYVDVEVQASPSATASQDEFEFGPEGGGRIGWRPIPRLQVYGEGYFTYLFPDGIVPGGGVEFGVEYKAAGPVSVFGGWRWRNLELFFGGSDFDFEWSGAFVGVGFDF
jgi:hypothetical protein